MTLCLRNMSEEKSGDLFGVKPIGDAIKIATQGVVDGASAFLSRICLPAAEEFGLALKDRVKAWRTANVVSVAQKAEAHVGDADVHAPPRIVAKILDESSWVDDSYVQDMWAGLLASSCSEVGDDDSNLLFLNTLANMTKAQASMLNYFCDNVKIFAAENGLPWTEELSLTPSQLMEISGISDIHRLDREVDHMRGMELISGGLPLVPMMPVSRLLPWGLDYT